MKKLIPTLIFLVFASLAFAQFGINAGYRFNDAPEWVLRDQNTKRETELLGDGYSIGIDYWFRLKSVRIEFLPELNFSQFRNDVEPNLESGAQFYSLFLNTNFYVLNFTGDCDCPTFSKQDPIFQKGFFLQLSPGVSYANLDLILSEDKSTTSSTAFSLGAAAGLDIGVSDLLTITPIAGVRYYFSATWEGLEQAANGIPETSIGDETSSILQAYAALRLGFRLDD